MVDVRIELDDDVIKRLEVRAEAKGRTLEEEVRDIITRAAPLTPEERVALSDQIRSMQAEPSTLDSTDLIRAARDRR
jgi:antitoxin FitA